MTDVNFGYKQPPVPGNQPDNPLSAAGRFGRLSYLAWIFASTFVFYIAIFVAAFAFGVSGAMLGQPDASSGLFGGLSIIAILGFAVVYIAFLYFIFVFAIRRLHDLNQTGWLSLLFLVPLVNIIFGLYILFAKGTPGPNNYGPQRITQGWEKVLGWIYIVLAVLTVIATIILLTSFNGDGIKRLSQSSPYGESSYSEQQVDHDMAELKAQLEQLEKQQQNTQHESP